MSDESFDPVEFQRRVTQMPDQELLAIIEADPAQYREDALTLARAEIATRRLSSRFGLSSDVESTGVEADAYLEPAPGSYVAFNVFRSSVRSWDTLFAEAAAFATEIGRDRLISISHSEDRHEGVVTVWFWG